MSRFPAAGSMKKTDNADLSLKVEIREWGLERAKLGKQLRVLDLCAGEGRIWKAMRARGHQLASYTPCDVAPRMPGTIKAPAGGKGSLDARFLAGFDLSRFNVIDVDTYGEPWEGWQNIGPRLQVRTLVLLTWGRLNIAMISMTARDALGIPRSWDLPAKRGLAELAGTACLARGAANVKIAAAGRIDLDNVSYIALVCDPLKPKAAAPPA